MAQPWERYATQTPQPQGPWTKYAAAQEQALEQQRPTTASVGDIAKSAGSGIVRGLTGLAGLPGDVQAGVGWLFDRFGKPMTPEAQAARDTTRFLDLPTSSELRGAVENVTGPLYEPQSRAGRFAGTAAEFLPTALVGPGGAVRRIASALGAGVGSEAAGQASEGSQYEPYARLAGALAGSVAPSVATRAVTPLPISQERQAMVDTLRSEGITPTAGQITGRHRLQAFEQELGGHAFQRAQSNVADQFTAAALRRSGINSSRATPEVMDQAFSRIGGQFDDLASRTSVPLDAQLQDDILNAVVDYEAIAGMPARVVAQAVDRITDVATQSGGVLQGQAYQNIRSKIGEWIRRADGPTKQALRDIQDALDDAVERHMPPQFLDQWREARRQYRNILVLEKAATGAGEEAAMGAISPARLRQSAVGQDRRGYVRGRNEFSDLGHAGQSIMTLPPRSGTPERLAVRGIPPLIGSMVGGTFGPQEAGIGFLAGTAAPYAMGRTVMSRPVQSYLANRAVQAGPPGSTAARAALIEALMAPRMLSAQ